MGASENRCQAGCLKILQMWGWFAWRNNTGVAMLPGRGGKPRPVVFGQKGSPDILAFRRAPWSMPDSPEAMPCVLALGVECKSERGRQSPEQKLWAQRWEMAGGVYLLVRSSDEMVRAMEERGLV